MVKGCFARSGMLPERMPLLRMGCFHKIRGRGIISQGTENCKGHELLERLKSREMRTNDMKICMLGVDFSALAKV
jgi:hypothetical protein